VFEWARIYLASHIDVSGSELIISSPSASEAGDAFNVVISGSILPADSDKDAIGSMDAPFADLYVQSSSVWFIDTSLSDEQKNAGKTFSDLTTEEKLAKSSRFGKDEIDALKRGESLNESGHITTSSNMT
jgi:hypothetical protein